MFPLGKKERHKDGWRECANFANDSVLTNQQHFNWIDLFETDELNNNIEIFSQ